jgi:hypothetical protein
MTVLPVAFAAGRRTPARDTLYGRGNRLTGRGVPLTLPSMIRLLRDMPAGVIGLEAVDDIEREDYENVIGPAVEAAIAEHGKVRLVYVLGHEFDEYEGEAIWEDVKLGARHPTSFARMAIVTDGRWAGPAIKAFSVLLPGKARAFRLAEIDAAKRWAADETDD